MPHWWQHGPIGAVVVVQVAANTVLVRIVDVAAAAAVGVGVGGVVCSAPVEIVWASSGEEAAAGGQ